MDRIKIIYTTNGIKVVCKECGEEIKSINHKCNIFKNTKWK